jgi:hypothetical protein
MAAKLLKDVFARALRHRLRHEVADTVWMQRIPPENLNIRWLIREMRLAGFIT